VVSGQRESEQPSQTEMKKRGELLVSKGGKKEMGGVSGP
jgi:hypothetical protein